VALSLGVPRRAFPPDVIRHRSSMEPGLSSPATFRYRRGAAVRPTDEIGMEMVGLRVKVCRETALRNREGRRPCFNERPQCQQRGGVSDTIDSRLPKMTLKRHNGRARWLIIGAAFLQTIPVRA